MHVNRMCEYAPHERTLLRRPRWAAEEGVAAAAVVVAHPRLVAVEMWSSVAKAVRIERAVRLGEGPG